MRCSHGHPESVLVAAQKWPSAAWPVGFGIARGASQALRQKCGVLSANVVQQVARSVRQRRQPASYSGRPVRCARLGGGRVSPSLYSLLSAERARQTHRPRTSSAAAVGTLSRPRRRRRRAVGTAAGDRVTTRRYRRSRTRSADGRRTATAVMPEAVVCGCRARIARVTRSGWPLVIGIQRV